MPGRVAGKEIVITGAGSGTSRALAFALAREADVRTRVDAATAQDSFTGRFGALDVPLSSAGFNRPMHLIDVTEEDSHSIMDVNAVGYLNDLDDFAGTALFLASTDSDYITGQVVMAGGGMVLVR